MAGSCALKQGALAPYFDEERHTTGAGRSQDSSFNANIHKLVLPAVPWYQERLLPNISLGSLVVVILIRTVKYNLSKLRDVYLHTNCLAALANMAPHVQNLNSYASQRLVSLFDMLARKCDASPFSPPSSLTPRPPHLVVGVRRTASFRLG